MNFIHSCPDMEILEENNENGKMFSFNKNIYLSFFNTKVEIFSNLEESFWKECGQSQIFFVEFSLINFFFLYI